MPDAPIDNAPEADKADPAPCRELPRAKRDKPAPVKD